jgi:hypothetical protein
MIIKHVPMKSATKSDFAGLVRYLTGSQGKNERVGLTRVTNCHAEQAEIAMLEVLNTQAQNMRATADLTYHLIVSFRTGEMPAYATLEAIEKRVCAALGLEEHQRVSVVHHDTDNLHMHIAINKIHPVRYTINEPFNAYHILGQVCDKLENEYGLKKDNHKAEKVSSENRAADMEQHAAVESLLGWIKRECKDQIQSAPTWAALHEAMRENGLQIQVRANGLVITADNGVSVKASSIAREFSKAKLEGRLGGFEPSTKPANTAKMDKHYDKRPMRSRINTVDLYARYRAAQQLGTTGRAAEWATALARKNRSIESAKRNARLKRAAIGLVRAPRIGKRLMYAATSKALRDDIAAINRQYLKERQQIYEKYCRRTWGDWLRAEATAGDREALAALRAREGATGLQGDTIGASGGARQSAAHGKPDSITKKGTIIYRVGASAVRDDGDKLAVSRGVNRAGLEAALRMAIERYGSRLTVSGSDSFKEQVAEAAATAKLPVSFDDDALERRRRQLAQAVSTKESKYGNDHNSGSDGKRRSDQGRDRGARQAAASRAAEGAKRSGAATPPIWGHRSANGNKSNPRYAGKAPAPRATHGMRGLPELGVVHDANRSEVLLPGHVSGHMEPKGAVPDHLVRRHIHRPGRLKHEGRSAKAAADGRTEQAQAGAGAAPTATNAAEAPASTHGKPNVRKVGTTPPPASKDRLQRLSQLGALPTGERPSARLRTTSPNAGGPALTHRGVASAGRLDAQSSGQAAADRYITEREQTRTKFFDIPKHKRYTFLKDGALEYAGIRRIDGHALALLRRAEEIMVLPVDDATARRLKRMPIGHNVEVTANGAVKAKGRSR